MRNILEGIGLIVAGVVASGEDAIARAEETSPDLVLMDIRLRGNLDGIEAAGTIQDRFDIPVIYLTAHSDDATVNRAKRTGPFGYLLKPFSGRELRVTVEMALQKHAMQLRLRESEERYATTLTSIGDGVIATDTGSGMDAYTKAHLFEPFFTTKDLGRGTGLGLATVYGIVEQSGGYIYVHSEPGHGATFKVHLPEVMAPESPRACEPVELAPGTETVLLVEDDDHVRALTRSVLQTSGYTVLEAADGAEAIQLCEQDPRPIDLLLTDGIMPHISGRVLADRLTHSRPGIKVLFMSGHTEDHVLRTGVLAAEMAFIQKPFTGSELTRKVREVLDSRGSGSEGSPAGSEKL